MLQNSVHIPFPNPKSSWNCLHVDQLRPQLTHTEPWTVSVKHLECFCIEISLPFECFMMVNDSNSQEENEEEFSVTQISGLYVRRRLVVNSYAESMRPAVVFTVYLDSDPSIRLWNQALHTMKQYHSHSCSTFIIIYSGAQK